MNPANVHPYRLPRYACQFIEMCLMVTADHGPAVSGAHNTIVCARAGKDLISCLTSGLLTIVRPPCRSPSARRVYLHARKHLHSQPKGPWFDPQRPQSS